MHGSTYPFLKKRHGQKEKQTEKLMKMEKHTSYIPFKRHNTGLRNDIQRQQDEHDKNSECTQGPRQLEISTPLSQSPIEVRTNS